MDLVYFDKTQLSAGASRHLAECCSDSSFTPEAVKHVSVAAAQLCQWLCALNAYSQRQDNLRPTMQRLQDTQSAMKRVRSFFKLYSPHNVAAKCEKKNKNKNIETRAFVLIRSSLCITSNIRIVKMEFA